MLFRSALHSGRWEPLGVDGDVLTYARAAENGRRLVVAINFGRQAGAAPEGYLVLSTHDGEGRLAPHEARVVLSRP